MILFTLSHNLMIMTLFTAKICADIQSVYDKGTKRQCNGTSNNLNNGHILNRAMFHL